MRATTNIANVAGYAGYAGAGAAELRKAARVFKNLVLFAAAPFIGLAYAAAFPFIAVGMIAWVGARAALKRGKTA